MESEGGGKPLSVCYKNVAVQTDPMSYSGEILQEQDGNIVISHSSEHL